VRIPSSKSCVSWHTDISTGQCHSICLNLSSQSTNLNQGKDRSSSTSQLVILCTHRSTMGGRAFAVVAPRAWNSLPDSLHKLSSFVNFKKHLKIYLFTNWLAQHDIWCEALFGRLVLLTVLYISYLYLLSNLQNLAKISWSVTEMCIAPKIEYKTTPFSGGILLLVPIFPYGTFLCVIIQNFSHMTQTGDDAQCPID